MTRPAGKKAGKTKPSPALLAAAAKAKTTATPAAKTKAAPPAENACTKAAAAGSAGVRCNRTVAACRGRPDPHGPVAQTAACAKPA